MMRRYTLWVLVACLSGSVMLGAQAEKSKSGRKGYLGVSIQDVTPRTEKKFKLPNDEGAFVNEVVEEGPAQKAGILEDDVILSYNGKPVYDANDLSRFVGRTAPETKVELTVWRDGKKKTLPVTIGRKKSARAFFSGTPRSDKKVFIWSGGASLGAEVSTLGEQLAEFFAIPDKEGVLVQSVRKDGPAAKAGVQAGDVITRLGEEKIRDRSDLLEELGEYEERDKIQLEIYRKGSKKTVTVEVEEMDEDAHGFFFRDFGDHGAVIAAPRVRIPRSTVPEMHMDKRWLEENTLEDAHRNLRMTKTIVL